ncbi:MAG: hypothetical protein NT065_01945 [Chlamydiae bacterium]|nr:hypothetical protein [Chlamydiota bacterium]
MYNQKSAIFSCLGLGDGLIALILSNNLHLNGYQTTTFHPFLDSLQDWFPHLPLKTFPKEDSLLLDLNGYDRFYIFFEKSPWMEKIIRFCQSNFPDKTVIINPIATKNTDYPYWENARFNGELPFVDNLTNFCRDILTLPVHTKENGIEPSDKWERRRCPNRIIIHPTSSRPGKNWAQEKFIKLAYQLEKKGFEPFFILTEEERKNWAGKDFLSPQFLNLSDLAGFIYESGWMIGNDSGIGHLASCLGIKTLTIARNHKTSSFWRPSWSMGIVVHPPIWIPNIKGIRWRDKQWQKWISVGQAVRAFKHLINAN